ncbi:hypothetical protein YC2023_043387 [Brassica napus]
MELLVLSILADLSCKLSEESFSSRCDIEVFRHLELCRKHAAHDLSVFLRIPEEARELEKQPTQVTKESMSLCEAKYLRRRNHMWPKPALIKFSNTELLGSDWNQVAFIL